MSLGRSSRKAQKGKELLIETKPGLSSQLCHPFEVTKEKALEIVCRVFQVTPIEIKSKRRLRYIVDAKTALCYILHRKQKMTSTDTASFMNMKHCNVLHHCQKAEAMIETDQEFAEKFKQLRITYY